MIKRIAIFYFSILTNIALANSGLDFSITSAYPNPPAPPIIINEISNGERGHKEFVELLVVGEGGCEGFFDLRGFILDDNNGDFSNDTNTPGIYKSGVAKGHIRFKNIDRWANVPIGSLILIYNPADKNYAINLPDDPEDANEDRVYILPVNNDGIEGYSAFPDNAVSQDYFSSTNNYGFSTWDYITLFNKSDGFQIRYPDGTYCHGISYGSVNKINGGPNNLLVSEQSGYQRCFFFTSGDCLDKNNYIASYIYSVNPETPGTANNNDNNNFVSSVQNSTPQISCSSTAASINSTGKILVNFSGGEAPYLLKWEGPSNGNAPISAGSSYTIENLPPGDYEISISSGNGCIVACSTTIVITQQEEEQNICPEECTSVGLETDLCFEWSPTVGLENPSSSVTNACPEETTTYILTITDNQGNIIETITYLINVLNSDGILDYFESNNFSQLPYINITGSTVMISDSSNYQRVNSLNCNITDYADLLFQIDLEDINSGEIDLEVELSQYCSPFSTYFITSNSTFCDSPESIDEIENLLANCNELVVWYHIFENNTSPLLSDILFIKTNENLLYECVAGEEDIIYPQWDIFPESTNTNLSNFSYSVVQRAFGPWKDFGHLPLLGLDLSSNNFVGDNRGFSLGNHRHENDPLNPLQVTSRVFQKYDFVLGQDKYTVGERKSSGTRGIKNMNPKTDIPPCDWYHPDICVLTANIKGQERFEHDALYMHAYGRDECVDFSTNIDIRSKLVFDIQSDMFNNYLSIKGILLNKGFPSHEMFIEDNSGQKVFIYSNGPSGESDIVIPGLFSQMYDNYHYVNIIIEIDFQGNFGEVIFVGNLLSYVTNINDLNPMWAPSQSIHIIHNQNIEHLEFNFSTHNINDWNHDHLNKNPAEDCTSIPCCGDLGCCYD